MTTPTREPSEPVAGDARASTSSIARLKRTLACQLID
jgi:hypothetical protein